MKGFAGCRMSPGMPSGSPAIPVGSTFAQAPPVAFSSSRDSMVRTGRFTLFLVLVLVFLVLDIGLCCQPRATDVPDRETRRSNRLAETPGDSTDRLRSMGYIF